MTVNRRDVIFGTGGALGGVAALSSKAAATPVIPQFSASIDLIRVGLKPSEGKDQTSAFQSAVNEAAKQKLRLSLPGGTFNVGRVDLPDGIFIEGVKGATIIKFIGGAGFISAKDASSIALNGLSFDGNSEAIRDGEALLQFNGVKQLTIRDCEIRDGLLNGIGLQNCDGHILNCHITGCGGAGVFALDSKQFEISHNTISDCGNNGILVWRTEKGYDGTIVANNHISKISAKAGGTGQNGNGINVFRAGNVCVSGNVISDCEFSAVRNNAGDNVQILHNNCTGIGEVALYSEFGFEGAIVSNNLVDGAHVGISITNFNEGGRLATVTGNLIRNLSKRDGKAALGIAVEADSLVSGNVVENVPGLGISIGYGKYMRQVTANNNLVRDAKIGIGVSSHNEAGYAFISSNMIIGAKDGGIRAMDLDKPMGPDLSKASPEAFLNLAIFGNVSL